MDAAEDGMWWYRAVHARLAATLAARPRPGRVLDAGCGTGGGMRALAAALPGVELVGLEYDAAAAARAAAKSGRPVAGGDVNRLPFADGAFAAVVSVDVLCHRGVSEAEALAELRRVLAPGGLLVLNLPAFEWLRSAHDTRVHNARRYTARGARGLLAAAGFAGIETRYWNSLLLPLMVVQRKVLAAREDAASDVAPFPPWLDAALAAVDAAERRLAALGARFPAGGSVLALATKP
ncbi:class I SAM-dependent methyltransferase [Roseomonas sp. OT10]|uniref:class I SAM-dependent methyltransferase n=1 Tax=Roseomonas cutis TaxID=2897332 RepID=UPI001E635B84|nr:class I SAM-dependent methyltransferase [Roseomonas sp. OT10]UFN51292.1 class I SAM-dependent methyltransferase [Roseomonas sp. OT10]